MKKIFFVFACTLTSISMHASQITRKNIHTIFTTKQIKIIRHETTFFPDKITLISLQALSTAAQQKLGILFTPEQIKTITKDVYGHEKNETFCITYLIWLNQNQWIEVRRYNNGNTTAWQASSNPHKPGVNIKYKSLEKAAEHFEALKWLHIQNHVTKKTQKELS